MANELSHIHSDVPDTMCAFEPGSASRVQSWQSVSSLSSADHPSPRPVDLLEKDGKRLLSEASEIQLWWDAEMCKELKLPPGYRKVAVLLIKWSSDIDEFKERGEKEVAALKELLEERFNYQTLSVALTANRRRSPEVYLRDKIRKIMKHHDSANDLLIIYYSGHASFYDAPHPEDQYLELHATRESQAAISNYRHHAKLSWNNVEKILIDEGKGDMLVVMDACFAGNLNVSAKMDLGRAYEVLGACKRNRTTASPGPRSFTHILHKSLEDLVNRYSVFTTAHLLSAILEREERRNNPPDLWSRSANTPRNIRLAPMPKLPPSEHASYFDDRPIPQYLTLRVELKDLHRPSREEIEQLARNVSKAIRDSSIKTRRIDCMGLTPRTVRSLKTAAQMISSMVRFMGSRKAPQNPVASLDDVLGSLSPARKRPRSEGSDDDHPEPKRSTRTPGSSPNIYDTLTPKSTPGK